MVGSNAYVFVFSVLEVTSKILPIVYEVLLIL